ncbi:MAG TPA: AarF/UbiB family protein [Thermoanaerobaculia bacterium]|nr:AarF/UbiB family protein [Thermoanaerobaculia bacterium]
MKGSKLGLSLKPEHLKRYRDLVWLFVKYGRSDLVKDAGLDTAVEEGAAPGAGAAAGPSELAADLERLGPTYIKLGQLMSTRADLLPLPYLEALARLQDRIEPFAFEEVERIVSLELGIRLSKAFASFDPVPLAAASLGQVHRASLRDGRPVAVKVQRPNIRERIVDDLDALEEIAALLANYSATGRKYQLTEVLGELRKSLLAELDYRLEADNLNIFKRNLDEFPLLDVPSPIADYTSSRVLTMEFVRGRKITSLTPLARVDIDGSALAEELFRAYLQQILVDGFFHADPHPGNVFLTDEGHLALIDLGMVARVTPGLQEDLLQLLLAISEGRAEKAAEFAIRLGHSRPEFDRAGFTRHIAELVSRHQDADMQRLDAGRITLELTRISAEHGFKLPAEMTMIGKALLNLDQVVTTLDPRFDPNASIRRNAAEILRGRMWKSLSPGHVLATVLEAKDFAEKLPGRLNRILDAVANNELRVNVDAIDEELLTEGIQKVANRITVGLLLASLILGASLLMSVPTRFQLLGYPGLAILLFLAAAGGGILLLLNILLGDRSRRPRRKK